jgi:uncharacterized membrane protein
MTINGYLPSTAPAGRSVLQAWLTPPVIALTASLLAFGALGAIGTYPWTSWPVPLRWALAVMFLLTASARLGPRRHALAAMVPAGLPHPRQLVAVTGTLEALGALGLLLPQTALIAAWSLTALLVAMFPANLHAARNGIGMDGRQPTPLAIRSAQQATFIAVAVASALPW